MDLEIYAGGVVALYQKYRPKNFSDLIGEDHIAKTLKQAIKSGKLSHAYLLTGPRGTGKTSTARLLAKAFNCEAVASDQKAGKDVDEPCNECSSCLEISEGRAIDVIEIDAASHTKVDEIREVIDKARFMPTKLAKKVYIIDEVHMLSNSSFNALLKTLEEPPAHVAFVLATTESHKLPATIISRTQRFDFRRVKKEDLIKNIKSIAEKENIKIDDKSLDLIAVSAEGGHRDAIGLLEQVACSSKNIDYALTREILGVAEVKEVFDFLGAIFNANPEEGLKIAHRVFENGIDMTWFVRQVLEYLRKVLIYSETSQVLFEDTDENISRIKELGQDSASSKVVKLIEIFIESAKLLKESSYPILPVEIAIVESCSMAQQSSADSHQSTVSDNNQSAVTSPKQAPVSTQQSKVVSQQQTNSPKTQVQNFRPKNNNLEQDSALKKPQTADSKPQTKSDELTTETIDVFQMTDDLWQRVIDEVKTANATLAALLRDAKPLEIEAGKVNLGVRFKFHKDKISEGKNVLLLEKIFSDIIGSKCVIACEIMDKKKEKVPLKKEELQKAAEEIFA